MLTIDEAIASYEKSAERYHKSFLRNKAHGGEFYQREAESDRICEEHERSKHWDGHTEKDVTRLLSLPKAQLSQQGTTSDLISRQQTLNALMDAVKSVGVLDADDIKTVFDALPSVQHEKAQLFSEGTTFDLISRQAAIDVEDGK